MALSIGNTEPTTVYLGDQELTAIYLGDTEIWRKNSGVLPIYRLAGDSASLPIGASTALIPNAINPSDVTEAFYAAGDDGNVFGNSYQVWSDNGCIHMRHSSRIMQYIRETSQSTTLDEFTIKYKYSDLQRDPVRAPSYGYAFMNALDSSDAPRMDLYLDEDDHCFYILLERGSGTIPTIDTSSYSYGTGDSRLKIYDFDFSWLQNNGSGREFVICYKNNVAYLYIDGEQICHQTIRNGYNYAKVNIGTRWNNYGGFAAANVQIDNFEIYDTCIFPNT